MVSIVSIGLLLGLLVLSVLAWQKAAARAAKSKELVKQAAQRADEQAASIEVLTVQLGFAKETIAELEPYRTVLDAKKEVQRILNSAVEDSDRIKQQAQDTLNRARESARMQQTDATKSVEEALRQAQAVTQRASQEAERVIRDANQDAEQLRSEAREATSLAKAQAKETLDKAQAKADEQVAGAHHQAQAITQQAKQEAERVIRDTNQDVAKLGSEARDVTSRAKAQAKETQDKAQAKADEQVAGAYQQAQAITQRANQEAEQLRSEAKEATTQAKVRAKETLDKAQAKADEQIAEAQKQVTGAHDQAQAIIRKAKQDAEQIAGDAYVAMQKADSLQKTLQALEGAVKGYGNAYIVPTCSLLDDLADEFSHADAGNNLRRAREHTRKMVLNRTAASCDYVEANRRETAISFVTDAFNGKVDSVLSRVKSDNAGKLEQEIRGAFQLVNQNGGAFRNARVTAAYLDARLDELRWAATAKALQDQEREEQRRLREQIREEERARKEFERAIKEAEKEETAIQKAMEKVQAQVQKASEAQKAVFEAQLAELTERLRLAEEKSQRALSMAQQTRVGHVYVISNIGSFGENVYKIGMTRRLEPLDRVRELGDASVPFEFDVHAMIYSDDAPKLEKSLHSHFMRAQVNKVNPRKEFFRIGIDEIMEHVESTGIQAHWTLTAKAASFRESQRIEQSLLGNTEEAQRWAEIQAETIEADESQEEAEPA